MKNSTNILLALSVGFLITACAKSDDKKAPAAPPAPAPAPVAPANPEKPTVPQVPSVDENGLCTPAFLQAWKSVESAMSNTNRAGGIENAVKACDDFFANHSGVVCKIKSATTEEENFLESKSFQGSCAAVRQSFGKPAPEEPVNPSPVPQDDDKKINETPVAQITTKILNVEKVKTSMANSNVMFVNGRIGTLESFNNEIGAGATYCRVLDTKSANADKIVPGAQFAGQELKDEVHRNGNRILLIVWGDFFGLGCSKLSKQPFNFGEVRAAMRGIVELRATP